MKGRHETNGDKEGFVCVASEVAIYKWRPQTATKLRPTRKAKVAICKWRPQTATSDVCQLNDIILIASLYICCLVL